jgi:hypothetical protein
MVRALQGQRDALGESEGGISLPGVLQREVTSNRQVYEALLQRAKQTEISSELKTTNIQIVDPAEVPEGRVWPQRGMILLLGLVIGVPLGLGSIVGVEYLDDRVKSPDEIKIDLGFRFLGFAPAVPRKLARKGVLRADGNVPLEFAEALRAVAQTYDASSRQDGVAARHQHRARRVKRWSPSIWRWASRKRDAACCWSTRMRRPRCLACSMKRDAGLSAVLKGVVRLRGDLATSLGLSIPRGRVARARRLLNVHIRRRDGRNGDHSVDRDRLAAGNGRIGCRVSGNVATAAYLWSDRKTARQPSRSGAAR